MIQLNFKTFLRPRGHPVLLFGYQIAPAISPQRRTSHTRK